MVYATAAVKRSIKSPSAPRRRGVRFVRTWGGPRSTAWGAEGSAQVPKTGTGGGDKAAPIPVADKGSESEQPVPQKSKKKAKGGKKKSSPRCLRSSPVLKRG